MELTVWCALNLRTVRFFTSMDSDCALVLMRTGKERRIFDVCLHESHQKSTIHAGNHHIILGGGCKYFVFSPRSLGKESMSMLTNFQMDWLKPPTRFGVFQMLTQKNTFRDSSCFMCLIIMNPTAGHSGNWHVILLRVLDLRRC